MSEQQTPNMTPVDALVCDDGLQAMKACIPFMNPREQSLLLAFTKFLEFRRSIRLIQEDSGRLEACSIEPALRTPVHMLNHIKSYCTESQRHVIESMLNCFQMLQLYQMFQTQPGPEGSVQRGQSPFGTFSEAQAGNPADYLQSLLTEEQRQMFRQFSETVQKENKGGDENGE